MTAEQPTVGRALLEPDPDWMYRVPDCRPSTLDTLIDLLHGSTIPEHWLYREAELDDLWRHAEMEIRGALVDGRPTRVVDAFANLHRTAFEAHDLAAAGRLDEAAGALARARDVLDAATIG